jgi:hypothetical protein
VNWILNVVEESGAIRGRRFGGSLTGSVNGSVTSLSSAGRVTGFGDGSLRTIAGAAG